MRFTITRICARTDSLMVQVNYDSGWNRSTSGVMLKKASLQLEGRKWYPLQIAFTVRGIAVTSSGRCSEAIIILG
jgi:hypothetical protein